MSCTLCTALPSAGEIVFDSPHAAVLLHPDSAVAGHAMVVARRHVENLSDLSEEEAAELVRVERAAERALLEVTGCERAVLMKLGIQTPHLHVHIYPVRASADRDAVMRAIDGEASEPRRPGLAGDLRRALARLTSPAE